MSETGRKKLKIALTVCLLVLLFVLGWLGWKKFDETRLVSITVEGCSHYTESEIIDRIFPNAGDRRTLLVWLREKQNKHETIPFVSRYEITLTGPDSCEIMVYEKNIVACLEYMGSVLYFDKDGIIVECGEENTEGVPVVTGIQFTRLVMYETLQVENEAIFSQILTVTQGLDYYGISADKIYFSENMDTRVYCGSIRVELGSASYLNEKMQALAGILPELAGRSGILFLDSYSPDNATQFRFRPDPEG